MMRRTCVTLLPQRGKLAHHPLRRLAISGNVESKPLSLRADIPNPYLQQFLKSNGISADAFAAFDQVVSTHVVTPLSPTYDASRTMSDNAFDKYPVMVVTCNSTSDVVNTVKFAKQQKLQVSMRAGGHNTAGYSVLNSKLLIDVSGMKGVHVDPVAMVATVGAGVKWGQLCNELDAWGLHTVTGSCSDVGCLGYTLGGGYGYTSMQFGMGCDNLIGITMVTHDGKVVTASEAHNPDLLWAHRGGTGGNFGVVVGLTYRLHKLRDVYCISVNWPIEYAAQLMTTWQNTMTKTLKDRHLGLLGFLCFGERTATKHYEYGRPTFTFPPYFCVRGIYTGDDLKAGKEAFAPLWSIGKPQIPAGCPQPFTKESKSTYNKANEHLLDNTEGVIPDTIKETKRCAFVKKALTQPQYQKIVDKFCESPCEYNIMSMEPGGGRINEIKPDAAAYVHRDAYWDIFTDSFWNTEAEKPAAFKWLLDMYESPAMKELWSPTYYQNYPNELYRDYEHGYWGSNYPKLQQIKKEWDPDNFFTFPQAIKLPK